MQNPHNNQSISVDSFLAENGFIVLTIENQEFILGVWFSVYLRKKLYKIIKHETIDPRNSKIKTLDVKH